MLPFTECRLCGQIKDFKLIYKYDDCQVYRCTCCGFTFIPDNFRKNINYALYKKNELIYEEIRKSDHELKLHRHYQRIAFFEDFAKGKKLLDVGSGWGHFVWAALNKGYEAKGLELAEYPAKFSMEELKLPVYKINFFELDSDEKFDIITFWDVLEHIDDIHGFIRKCSDLQNTGGIIVLQVPAIDSPVARKQGKNWKMIGIDHVNYFSKETMKRLLESHGYEMIKFKYNSELKLFLMYYVFPLIKKFKFRKKNLRETNLEIPHEERQAFFNKITRGSKFKKRIMLVLHDVIMWVFSLFNFGEEMMVVARKKNQREARDAMLSGSG
ncbi:MAG: class I SAM-dependent methyltransferase [Bacteroidia bacterium]|nr:class I SAM-dependent methyltransferase [Bacteroidia bacterium]